MRTARLRGSSARVRTACVLALTAMGLLLADPGVGVAREDEPRRTGAAAVVGKTKRAGFVTRFLTPGEAGTGVPNPDPAGGELDMVGDVGALSGRRGDETHVASGNLWTTTFGAFPVSFEGPALKRATILGGTVTLTAFLQEPFGRADVVGSISVSLLDVFPDGTERSIARGESAYVSGVRPAVATYALAPVRPYEVRKGHRIRLEIAFTCVCSTALRFYYGSAEFPARISAERYVRA